MKILCSTPDTRASELSLRTGLPITSSIAPNELVLVYEQTGLELRNSEDKPGTGVKVETKWLRHAMKRGLEHLRGDPLARALNAGNAKLTVIDATAGLGGDSLLFAALGHQVTAIERNIAVWALLDDGLQMLRSDPELSEIAARITLHLADARDYITQNKTSPDVIYIDPMFPPKRRASALPPLELQRLRSVVGEDLDAAGLLEVARAHATHRVVVKRPNDGKPLADGVLGSHQGKTVHYDIYRKG
ncbi:MAG: class I SAM-dependent methyltransferase [Deltaproteobacteria bacterium]|nr:class I SAM-dependent methyltransferase [Deltaproteobacteria bacterium]